MRTGRRPREENCLPDSNSHPCQRSAYLLLGLAIGAVLGVFIGWLLGARKQTVAPSDARLENMNCANNWRSATTDRVAQTRDQLSQSKTSLATAQAGQAAAEKILAEQRQLHEQTLRRSQASAGKSAGRSSATPSRPSAPMP